MMLIREIKNPYDRYMVFLLCYYKVGDRSIFMEEFHSQSLRVDSGFEPDPDYPWSSTIISLLREQI